MSHADIGGILQCRQRTATQNPQGRSMLGIYIDKKWDRCDSEEERAGDELMKVQVKVLEAVVRAFHSKWDGRPLQGFEQRSDMIYFKFWNHSDCCVEKDTVGGTRVEEETIVLIQAKEYGNLD